MIQPFDAKALSYPWHNPDPESIGCATRFRKPSSATNAASSRGAQIFRADLGPGGDRRVSGPAAARAGTFRI